MLILFDIDATLLVSSRSGLYAMQDAGRELFGSHFTFDQVDFAGRLDPLILRDLLVRNGCDPSPTNVAAMRRAYGGYLSKRLSVPGTAKALPGVLSLLDALRGHVDVTLGVLTGNFEESGLMKLRAAAIDPSRFAIQVWGDHSPHDPPSRSHLPPVAIAALRRHRPLIGPSDVWVVGDTPHDVACARDNSCRSIAVATGLHSVEQLKNARAEHVVRDLSDTSRVLSILLGSTRRFAS